MDLTQISVAIYPILVAVAVAGIMWFESSIAAASARRLMGMMKRIGLDPEAATLREQQTKTIGKEMRRRCRECPNVDHCQRWLARKVKGGNTFCPLVETFRILARACAVTLKVPAH